MSATDKIDSLTVRDVMSTDLTTIAYSQSMQQAAQVLREQRLIAAPVVNEVGKLVGIITARHFLALEEERDWTDQSFVLPSDARLSIDQQSHQINIEVDPSDPVDRHMNCAVQTIDESAPIREAALMMCAGDIHHLIVVDETDRPTGLVSALDLLGGIWDCPVSRR